MEGNKLSNQYSDKKRRVYPYQLLFDSGVWYLYGFAEERQWAADQKITEKGDHITK